MIYLKLLTHVLVPLLVFYNLTSLVFEAFRHSVAETGLGLNMGDMCKPGSPSHPYRLEYTTIPSIDEKLCRLVTFFQALMDEDCHPLLAALFPVVGVVTLLPFLEAARTRRSFLLGLPTVVGILFQIYSMAVIMPTYCLLFIATGATSLRRGSSASKVTQAAAEALLFGLVLGYVLPTVLMLFLDDFYITAIWQGFPVIVGLGVFVHKLFRSPSRHPESGHSTVVATLTIALIASAVLHALYVWPILTDIDALRAQFWPVSAIPDPASMSLGEGTVDFIKWDLIFGAGAVMLATLWTADSLLALVGILAWYSIMTVALGPAAAIFGVLLWRETRLN